MRISHIKIVNSARCQDVDADVRKHLVLVGPNDAGKSTILRLLDAALSWSHGRLLGSDLLFGIRDTTDALVVEITVGDLDPRARAAFADEIEVHADDTLSLTIRMESRVSADDPEEIEVSRSFVKVGVQPIRVTQRHLGELRWAYLAASRSPDRELGTARSGTIRSLLDSVDLGDDHSLLLEALAGLNAALADAQSITALREAVAAALSSVYPRDVSEDDISVELPSSHEPLGDVDLRLNSGDGSEPVALLAQSDGLRSLAVLSLQLMVHDRSAITALDEPEMHLHPRSQARVARVLAEDEGQRIVATHSPTVVRSFRPSDVLALTTAGTRQLEHDAVESDKRFFHRWWTDEVLGPLTGQRLVLVEGPSDESIVRRVASLLSVDLDREAISVVALGSANNFTNAYRLFGPTGFGIPTCALVDEAESAIPAEALDIAESQLEDHGVFVCAVDLEAVYCGALGVERVVESLLDSDLVTETQVLQSARVTERDELTLDKVTSFCRKRKTIAALAVADALEATDLAAMSPVPRLFKHLH